jgi:hypothetical protein
MIIINDNPTTPTSPGRPSCFLFSSAFLFCEPLFSLCGRNYFAWSHLPRSFCLPRLIDQRHAGGILRVFGGGRHEGQEGKKERKKKKVGKKEGI